MQNLSLLLSPNQAAKNTQLDSPLAEQEEGLAATMPFADILKGEVQQHQPSLEGGATDDLLDDGLIQLTPEEGVINPEGATLGAIASLFETAPTKVGNVKEVMANHLQGLSNTTKAPKINLARLDISQAVMKTDMPADDLAQEMTLSAEDSTIKTKGMLASQLANTRTNVHAVTGNMPDIKGFALGKLKSDKRMIDTDKASTALKKLQAEVSDVAGGGKAKAVAADHLKTAGQQVLAAKQVSLAAATHVAETKAEGFASTLANQVEATTTVSTQSMVGMQRVAAEVLPSNQINTPFSSPNWNQAVQQKVVWMVGAADKSATLTLNPPELGPLKVVVQVDNQSVDTTFISDNPEVRQALQDGMLMLKDKMLEMGIQLGQTNVNTNAQSQEAFQQALKQNQDGKADKKQAGGNNDLEREPETTQGKTNITTTGSGLVDTFV